MQQISVSIQVNGRLLQRTIEPRLLLVHFLRDVAGLTGTKVGCDTSQCGSCTVLLDGRSLKSCTCLAAQADGSSVTTIEGLSASGQLHALQESFWAKHGLQCGFCTPGMVMNALDFAKSHPNPTDQEVREALEGNLCRCTGYHNIVKSIVAGAKAMGGKL